MREIIRLVVVLSLICGISAGSLALARKTLGPKIEKQSDLFVRGPALERLFKRPAAELLDNKISLSIDGKEYPVFYIKDGGEVSGLAVEAPGQGGYGGDIIVMIGIDLVTNRILGIEIVQHNETPGVGSKVEKPAFRQQWIGLSVQEPVNLKSQGGSLDAISGATYSSKAMVSGTNRIIEIMSLQKDNIASLIAAKEAAKQ